MEFNEAHLAKIFTLEINKFLVITNGGYIRYESL